MENLDEQLKNALRRVDSPPGFAERVLAQAKGERRPVRGSFWRAPMLRWAVAAVVIIAASVGAFEYRREQRARAQGEAAKQQAVIALRIAGAKLKLAQAKVQHLSERQLEEQ